MRLHPNKTLVHVHPIPINNIACPTLKSFPSSTKIIAARVKKTPCMCIRRSRPHQSAPRSGPDNALRVACMVTLCAENVFSQHLRLGQGGGCFSATTLTCKRCSSLVDVLHDALWGYSSGRPILLEGGQATPEGSTAMARFAACQRRDERDMKKRGRS